MGNFNFGDIPVEPATALTDVACATLAKQCYMPYEDGYFILTEAASYFWNRITGHTLLHSVQPWKLVPDFKMLIEFNKIFKPNYDTVTLFSRTTDSCFLTNLELCAHAYYGFPPKRITGVISLLYDTQLTNHNLSDYFQKLYDFAKFIETAIDEQRLSPDILYLKFKISQYEKDDKPFPDVVQSWLKLIKNTRFALIDLIQVIQNFYAVNKYSIICETW